MIKTNKRNPKEFGQTILNKMNIEPLDGLQILPYKGAAIKWWLMPKNDFDMGNPSKVSKFNEVYNWIKANISPIYVATTQAELNEITQKNKDQFMYCIIDQSVSSVITICFLYYRIICKLCVRDIEGMYTKNNGKKLHGYQAFAKFRDKCYEMGINLDDYAISKEEGLRWKEQIQKPLIDKSRLCEWDKIYTNVHHIDFHNSYPAGLVNTHPEFKPVVEFFYKNRKVDPINKAVLNYTIGYMQSGKIDYKYAKLSHDAINDNNDRIIKIAVDLSISGRIVLAYNTDGIWYSGNIYHGEGEGKELGQWENDHTNCTFRMKSAGAYEFIEGDEYHPIIRGKTKLDDIKPRNEWKWGDIYNYEADQLIKYEFSLEKGITEVKDNE